VLVWFDGSVGDSDLEGGLMHEGSADSPGVRIPPPLFYLVGLVIGILMSVWIPSVWVPLLISRTIGGLLLGLGLILASSAVFLFRRIGTTIRPDQPSTSLATGGPYRFTRNPMYLSLALCYAGIAILNQSIWALLLLPLVLFVIQDKVIKREERHLGRCFGSEYTHYKSRVRRWI
jgi:protein-S-isoprenylcysteine O-methyltransferase Ste14